MYTKMKLVLNEKGQRKRPEAEIKLSSTNRLAIGKWWQEN